MPNIKDQDIHWLEIHGWFMSSLDDGRPAGEAVVQLQGATLPRPPLRRDGDQQFFQDHSKGIVITFGFLY